LSFALGELIEGLRGSIKTLAVPREEKVLVRGREFTATLMPDLEDGGYTASCKEIPAAISQGETIQEALDNIDDAIGLCLETEAELQAARVQAR